MKTHQNALKILRERGFDLNGEKYDGREFGANDMLDGGYIQLRVGKKDFRLVKIK